MSDAKSVSRLQHAQQEIDRALGPNFARDHPDVLIAVMQNMSSDYAALVVAHAIQDVAAALVEGVELSGNAGLVAARSTLVRP
jgi:hypothetical protein